jgi:hypothetical protein
VATSTPVAFTTLPRVAGTELADGPAAQARLAPVIDANFTKVNPYAATYPDKFKVRRVSGSNLLTYATRWTWWAAAEANVQGWYYGDVRSISFIGKYTGARILADAYGNLANTYGVDDQIVATIKDTRFLVGGGQYLSIAAATTSGLAGVYMTDKGVICLATISEPKGALDPNDFVSFVVTYMVR